MNAEKKSLIVSMAAALLTASVFAQGVGTSATFKGPVGVQIYSLRNPVVELLFIYMFLLLFSI